MRPSLDQILSLVPGLSDEAQKRVVQLVLHEAHAAWSPPAKPRVVMYNAGVNKIGAIKAVRELMAISLKDAKDLVEAASSTNPQEIQTVQSPETALHVLQAVGCIVEIVT